jgi:drug/metabolite transporter (DMT)-like permease
VNPVVAVLLGAAFVGEQIGPTTLVGGAITVAAVAMVITEESRRRGAAVVAAPEAVPDRRAAG